MKTFKAMVDLPENQHGFIGGKRVYGGSTIDVTEGQFSTKWMKRLVPQKAGKQSPQKPLKMGSGA